MGIVGYHCAVLVFDVFQDSQSGIAGIDEDDIAVLMSTMSLLRSSSMSLRMVIEDTEKYMDSSSMLVVSLLTM